ncbi:hypothetical protein Q9233_016362 [Columba guinea]|nr:hypothetical protein Q9233_016362 [Columba guinea]
MCPLVTQDKAISQDDALQGGTWYQLQLQLSRKTRPTHPEPQRNDLLIAKRLIDIGSGKRSPGTRLELVMRLWKSSPSSTIQGSAKWCNEATKIAWMVFSLTCHGAGAMVSLWTPLLNVCVFAVYVVQEQICGSAIKRKTRSDYQAMLAAQTQNMRCLLQVVAQLRVQLISARKAASEAASQVSVEMSDWALQSAGFVRLVDGKSRCSGRVEIRDGDQWKTVCGSHFGPKAAEVVCRELWCGVALPVSGGGPADSASLRLVGGGSRCDGRVEIFQHGTWGRVLDDQWDVREASVVCRQLRCGEAEKAYSPPKPERGTGPVGLRGVRCAGHEASLTLCNTSLPGSALLGGVVEDVGVICWEFVALRLENSGGCSGRLQVFYNGTWGSVCSNSMTPDTVSLVCKELGCGDGGSLEADLPYGRVSGPAWLDYVQCEKGTSSFWQCPSTPWDPQSCDDLREETHITCNGSRTAQELFPEAVYEEIGHSPAWEKQARSGRSGSSSEQSLTQLQPYPGHREEEDGLASASGGSLCSQRSVGVRGAEGDTVSLSPGSMGYDDAEEISLAHL